MTWLFHNAVVLCERCGFAFVSPCFSADSLDAYYADSFAPFAGQELDFSPTKRLEFIDAIVGPALSPRRVIEIGGNADTPFQDGLRERFGAFTASEPNVECSSDFRHVQQVPGGTFDLLVHYFILEHVAEVRPFLRECHRLLKPGGVMIVEVPDLLIYPRDIGALIFHEHCNHFTVENLRHLAGQESFRLIEANHDLCSRTYGFVAAFERLPDGVTEVIPASVFERNLAAITAGVRSIERFRATLADARADLLARPDHTVVLWGANDNLMKFLADGAPGNVVLVDSDPRKRTFHPTMTALLPEDAVDAIRSADRLILLTRAHAPAILSWIRDKVGRVFEEPVILDY